MTDETDETDDSRRTTDANPDRPLRVGLVSISDRAAGGQ